MQCWPKALSHPFKEKQAIKIYLDLARPTLHKEIHVVPEAPDNIAQGKIQAMSCEECLVTLLIPGAEKTQTF